MDISTHHAVAVVAAISLGAYLGSSSKKGPFKDPKKSCVLITGGARGIGRDTANYLISRGYSVIVTVRKQSQYVEMQIAAEESNNQTPYPILFDVTKDEHVPTATKQLESFLEQYGKELIAVVNNAGINPEAGEGLEKPEVTQLLADPSLGSRVLETNVIGVGGVRKAFLPILSKGGTIVNIGSYYGSIAGAWCLHHCYYEASKFALEGMTDNMRRSLKKEGIRVVLVKPGNIVTDLNPVGEVSTEVVSKDIERAIASTNPKPRYYPGKVAGYSCQFICRMYEMLPTSWLDRLPKFKEGDFHRAT